MVIPGGTGHGRGGIAGWLARYHEPPSARVFCRRREAASHRLHPVLPPWKFRNFISTGEAHARILTTTLFHWCIAGVTIGSGPCSVVHHSPQRKPGTAGWTHLSAGDRDGELPPGGRRDAGPFGDPVIVSIGVRHGEISGRRVLDLSGHPKTSHSREGNGERGDQTRKPGAHLLAGVRDQPVEPEDRVVFLRLPAPVRRPEERKCDRSDVAVRRSLCGTCTHH